MKLRSGFIVKEIGGKCVAIAAGDLKEKFNGMLTLNPSAKIMFDKLQAGVGGIEDLADALTEVYDVSRERAIADAGAFVETLKKYDLTEDDE